MNVQPVLCGGNGNGVATDLQIVLSESSDSILVFLRTALLERIRCSREVLRRLFREADREDTAAPRERVGTVPGGAVTGCPDDGLPGTEAVANDNRSPEGPGWPPGCSEAGQPPVPEGGVGSPASAEAGEPPELPAILRTAPSRPVGVHHAGLVLFLAFFATFLRGRRQWADLQRQWLGQVLQGAVNLEQSRMVTATDLARFTGPVVAGVEAQRERLRELAGVETVMDLYAANARLVSDGPGRGTVFYYDPHGKEYTGQLAVLKGWCGRRHGIVKVLYLDTIHSERGRACFAQHCPPYYDLRERFFMTMEPFNRLFGPERRRGRTFVLDRGIYGLDEFGRFMAAGDYVLTWEKGYAGGAW